jgi:hypothetical protein
MVLKFPHRAGPTPHRQGITPATAYNLIVHRLLAGGFAIGLDGLTAELQNAFRLAKVVCC